MRQAFFNGNIITMNDAQPKAEALLLEDGVIVAVGSNEEILDQRGDASLIDLGQFTVLPGFIDCHSYFCTSYAFPRFDPSPVGKTNSVEDLIEQARLYLDKHPVEEGQWFVGMGYDHALFSGKLHPTRYDLDRISTEIPIAMINTSGWMCVVNSKLIEVLGLTKDTPVPEGGIIYYDENGELSGQFADIAMRDTVLEKMPMPTGEYMIDAICRAAEKYSKTGYTTVTECNFEGDLRPLMQFCTGAGLISLDVMTYTRVAGESKYILEDVATPDAEYRTHFKMAGAKIIFDGSPQIRTAWMREPYFHAPRPESDGFCGYPTFDHAEDAVNLIKECLENRWQVQLQCNGDAAIDQALDCFEIAKKEVGLKEDLRPILVHAQTIREDQLDRAQALGVLTSFFHDHVYYWGDWYANEVFGPERASRISPLASALKREMNVTIHQDCPIGPPNVMLMLHTAVNRTTRSGKPLGQEYAIDIYDALKAVTVNAAYQMFDEKIKGSLEVGKLGDMVLLDRDILTVPKETIRDIKVMATIKEGKIIYQADEVDAEELKD